MKDGDTKKISVAVVKKITNIQKTFEGLNGCRNIQNLIKGTESQNENYIISDKTGSESVWYIWSAGVRL